jgi:hypothetical protein
MSDEPSKESRPEELADPADPDVPQDPGIPGSKAEKEQEEGWAPPATPRGFPESAHDDGAKQAAAEADETLPPGSMPPEHDEPAR